MGAMRQGTNGFAIASIVCAFLCSPLGLVFGIIARSQINRTGQGGAGLATAGIVVSIALIALNIALAVSGHALVHLNQGSTG
jgi:peptidyl-prolyl cis-trans isomerase B (cyclophilin B)